MAPTRAFTPLWFISLSAALVIIILPLFRQGMFLDGVIYAAIAKNLSLGHGTLWQPFYSQTHFPEFYEHPPLAIYFQSIFFKLFGQGYGVEQFYCFIMAVSQFALIAWYWLKKENVAFATLGLLLFLWLLTPLNHLYTSNMLEGTLTLFTGIASLVLLIKTTSNKAYVAQYVISSASILIAFFCNGPTAFFPLAVPIIRGIVDKECSFYQAIKETMLLITLLILMFLCVYLGIPDALVNTQKYFQQQLLASVFGMRQLDYVGFKHFNIIYLFFRACWPIGVFSLLCVIVSAKIASSGVIKTLQSRFNDRNFLLFFLLALVSSLPVGVSHRQAFNYIMQSAPFITLSMMWFCYAPMKIIINYCCNRSVIYLSLVGMSYCVFAGSLIALILLSNGYNRNEAMLKDIRYLTRFCKNDDTLSTSARVFNEWYTGAYLSRNSMISITPSEGQIYYLALKEEAIPESYRLINTPLFFYNMGRHV